MKINFLLSICIVSLMVVPISSSIESSSTTIEITEVNNTYQVKEHIIINSNLLTNTSQYQFKLPSSADSNDMTIVINNIQLSNPQYNNSIYTLNINRTISEKETVTVDLTYYLPISSIYFEKTFLEKSSNVKMLFEESKIFESNVQSNDTTIQVKLIKPVQSDSFNLYTVILIVLLIVIIIVTSYYAFIKRKNGKDRKRRFESSEVLETEKTLLLSMLKEIEKLHRAQKISDDSYHKLKSYYKNQTVEIMSMLDEQTTS
jgi:hypothetical protein